MAHLWVIPCRYLFDVWGEIDTMTLTILLVSNTRILPQAVLRIYAIWLFPDHLEDDVDATYRNHGN